MLRKGILRIGKHTNEISNLRSLIKSSFQGKSFSNSQWQRTSKNQFIVQYDFSSSSQKDDSNPKQSKDQQKQPERQKQERQTIQVSYQEFNKMKQLLQQLKSQISTLQKQGIPKSSSTNAQKQSPKISSQFKNKFNEFTKKSNILQPTQSQQKLFFNSLEQQLSFELIKLNSKEQFTELVDIYMKKFILIRNLLSQQELQKSNELLEHLKLLYLIFFRYTSLQNGRFDDFLLRKLVVQLSKHINLFEQNQVEKFISILNDQSKSITDDYSQNQRQHQIKTLNQLTSSIRQNLLENNKVFEYKCRTDMNSQILSLISSFVFVDHGIHSKIPQNSLNLNTHFKNEDNQEQISLLYNPLNLSSLLFNSIKFSQSQEVQLKFYSLFVSCLSIRQKDFNEEEWNGKPLKLQGSLNSVTSEDYTQLQYEALVYFFDHIPLVYSKNLLTISEQNLLNKLMEKENYLERFSIVQQLRILYALLTNPKAVQLQSPHYKLVIGQLQKILLGPQSEQNLMQIGRNGSNIFEDNFEFLHYKKVVMILSQIGIQIYKNLRVAPVVQKTPQVISKLNNLMKQTLKYINLISLEKVEVQDMWKQEGEVKEKNVQKLILNLNVFEFIVNLNILSKWSVQLSGNPLTQETNVELLKKLITCYFGGLKRILTDSGTLGKEKRIQLCEQLVIVILVGRQHNVIHKSLELYLRESENAEPYTSLLKQTIGKDSSHKYFPQYTKICEQFKI